MPRKKGSLKENLFDYTVGDVIDGQTITEVHNATSELLIYGTRGPGIYYVVNKSKVGKRMDEAVAYYHSKENELVKGDNDLKIYLRTVLTAGLSSSSAAMEYYDRTIGHQKEEYATSLRTDYLLRSMFVLFALGLSVLVGCGIQVWLGSSATYSFFEGATFLLVGACGGFASIYAALPKLVIEKLQNKGNGTVNAIARLTVAAMFGLLGAYIVKSGLLAPALTTQFVIIQYLGAAAGGFSEYLVPNTLAKIFKADRSD